jgi:chorismate mutase
MSESETPLPIVCRGVRGAITADENTREAILAATRTLLAEIVAANDLHPDDLASAIFTTTTDLTAAYPAEAARQLGWAHVPLLCTHEMAVPGGLERCIRVLLHWNTALSPGQIGHVYLGEAQQLRPDLVKPSSS